MKTPYPPLINRLFSKKNRLEATQETPTPRNQKEMPAPTITQKHTEDGIALIFFDRPGTSANLFDIACLCELEDHIERIASSPDLHGVIFLSNKDSIFIAGADIQSLAQQERPESIAALIRHGQNIFQKIATLSIPTVAAIHGACLGGGYELALACDYRIASPHPCTKIGLPEIHLGILPGWGGSTRLPRLVGLPQALDIILKGTVLPSQVAQRRGLIDEIIPQERFTERAKQLILKGKRPSAPFFWSNTALSASLIRSYWRHQLEKKTQGHYPAVTRALEVVTRTCQGSLQNGFTLEKRAILDLISTETYRHLIQLFLFQEKAKKVRAISQKGLLDPPPTASLHQTMVVGAGIMGSGIAQWLSAKGFPVTLRDLNTQCVAKGMKHISHLYDQAVRHKALTSLEAQQGMDRLSPTTEDIPLKKIDLVIEAAVEEMETKKKIFHDLTEKTSETTILATNTSALSITELAQDLSHPERILGLHFFNPVHRMPLVEVVVGKQTAPDIVDAVLQFTQKIGKIPIVVKDRPGFLINRILVPYILEAGYCAEEGAPLSMIDHTMKTFGMPMGPLRLVDEVGADIAWHVANTLATAFPATIEIPSFFKHLIQANWLGKKSGKGFYHYDLQGKCLKENKKAIPHLKKTTLWTPEQIQERLTLRLINESARCLQEGVVASPEDVDLGMVLGTGFAPFRGGPLAYADHLGLSQVNKRCLFWANTYGVRFTPCALLQELSQSHSSFYSKNQRTSWLITEPPLSPLSSNTTEPSLPPCPPQDSSQQPSPSPTQTSRLAPQLQEEPLAPLDTSTMSPGQRAALEMTEAAREDITEQEQGFVADLFMGKWNPNKIFPFPQQSLTDQKEGDLFLEKLEAFLKEKVDPDEIDRTGEIPQNVIDGLAKLGAFGIKIPKKYGGLGLSQTNYCRAATLLGSYCGNTTALLSAHQSIGVPQPLLLFGTEAQKQKYLPRLAQGEISAFALTENHVGSDPAQMETYAEPTPDGKAFILNGEKLWCTNGVKAGVIVVMAKTPPQKKQGRLKKQITAFLVEMQQPGIEIIQRCHFMGLRALYNGVIRFHNIHIPRENILWAEGKGLKVALTTLNTGRLTLPAACVGGSKRCLQVTRQWAHERVQWGAPIGKHAAIAEKIASMAADTFATEAMVRYTAALVDRNSRSDIRLEAAMAKLFGTESLWKIVDDTMQIRGGRGYETSASLQARGEPSFSVERLMRDSRINRIFEGSSEIMRLFIMREALDPHLKVGAPIMNSQWPWPKRLQALGRATLFYLIWYPRLWWPWSPSLPHPHKVHPLVAQAFRFTSRTSRQLARTLFHQMIGYGPTMDRQQVLLGRFAEIGTLLFVITVSAAYAQQLLEQEKKSQGVLPLLDTLLAFYRLKIQENFRSIHHHADRKGYQLAQHILQEKDPWLEEGILL